MNIRVPTALTAVGLLAATSTALAQQPIEPKPVSFRTSDGITIYGDLYRGGSGDDAPLVLLFHQAGSDARGEYGPLVGRILEQGFHALAIDQRNGGNRLGGINRTVEALEGREFGYCEAYPDLEAALSYADRKGFTGPTVAWGSSYSAALVIKLAAEHPDELAAILAFSPASGPPLAECDPGDFSPLVTIPALMLRPISEMQNERVEAQLETFERQGHHTYVADPGVHGSSMLNPARVGGSTDATWDAVLKFLHEVTR